MREKTERPNNKCFGVLFLAATLGLFVPGCATAPSIAPSQPTFSVNSTGVTLPVTRHMFTATPLPQGRWLLTGGHLEQDPKGKVSDTADILTSDSVKTLDNKMRQARWGHAATALNNGDVLVCGGAASGYCDRFEVRTGTFVMGGTLSHPRSGQAQVRLPNGKVLISGGYNKGSDVSLGKVLKSVEVFDPRSNTIKLVGAMKAARAGHAMYVYDGKTFIVGGNSPEAATVEVFQPASGTLESTSMQLPVALKDFQSFQQGPHVYLIGGTGLDGNSVDSVLKLDLKKQIVESMFGKLSEPREDMSLCSISKNELVVFGGEVKGNGRNGAHSSKADLITLSPFSVTDTGLELFRDDAQTGHTKTGTCLVIGGTNQHEDVDTTVLSIRQ